MFVVEIQQQASRKEPTLTKKIYAYLLGVIHYMWCFDGVTRICAAVLKPVTAVRKRGTRFWVGQLRVDHSWVKLQIYN